MLKEMRMPLAVRYERPLTWKPRPLMPSLRPSPENRWEPRSEARAWPAGAWLQGSRRQEEFPTRACPALPALRCQPCVQGARHREAGGQAGCSPRERVGQQRWSLGSIPLLAAKIAVLSQGRECAGRRPQPITPRPGGKGRRDLFLARALPASRGDSCACQHKCKPCLLAWAGPWRFQGWWWSLWAAPLKAGGAHQHPLGLRH